MAVKYIFQNQHTRQYRGQDNAVVHHYVFEQEFLNLFEPQLSSNVCAAAGSPSRQSTILPGTIFTLFNRPDILWPDRQGQPGRHSVSIPRLGETDEVERSSQQLSKPSHDMSNCQT